jgi:hypothetical protein
MVGFVDRLHVFAVHVGDDEIPFIEIWRLQLREGPGRR